jgi:DNA repair protein RecO (recombination protein O)
VKRNKTKGLILKRINFKDTDRIVTILTKDFGRISAFAKGVRKPKSRMAGGIEPFAISNVDFINGKSSMVTLVSARVDKDYSQVVNDYDRTTLGGEMLYLLNSLIEDDVSEKYFAICVELFESLLNTKISADIIETWFRLQLSSLLGREPDLSRDASNKKLDENETYHFNTSDGNLRVSKQGQFDADMIRAWRVLMLKNPSETQFIKGLGKATKLTLPTLRLFMAENNY